MVDINYYKTVAETQNDPEILKAELLDLIKEVEESIPIEPPVMQKIAEEFKNTIDYRILKDAYEWEVDIEEGYLWCLTAGDMGYEKTNFKLDVSNFSA